MKTYRPYSPEQSFLLPPSPREWLVEGHLAYFVLDLSAELDLETERGHAAYARRKATVEPVIGQIRTRGIRHMSFRGMLKNRLEWPICATHNLLELWRSRNSPAVAAATT